MTNNAQEHITKMISKERIKWLNLSNLALEGEMNLKEFVNLESINASNNKFTNLDWLLTLPNKEKLQKINLFGNEIEKIDFATLVKNFPNLELITLNNNPLRGNNLNLDALDTQELLLLNKWIAEGKIKIGSWKGNLSLDLLKFSLSLLQENKKLKAEISNLQQQINQTKSQYLEEELTAQQLQQTHLTNQLNYPKI